MHVDLHYNKRLAVIHSLLDYNSVTGLLAEVNKYAFDYMYVNLTGSPDACSRRWASTVYTLMPLPKQLVDHLAFMVHDCSLYLVHSGVPVLCLQCIQVCILKQSTSIQKKCPVLHT